MDRIRLCAMLAMCCLLLTQCHSAPVMSFFNVSNKPIQPRAPQAKNIVPLPYRAPAPVYEVQEDDQDNQDQENEIVDDPNPKIISQRVYKPYQPYRPYFPYYKPIKYGFVNTKTGVYDPRTAYNYNKRYIYSNYLY